MLTAKETAIRVFLGDQSYERYLAHLPEIEQIRNGIAHNRKGDIPLTAIANDPERMGRRLAREFVPPAVALERINGVPNFQDASIIKKIVRLSETVCRVITESTYGSSGYGTGFLVSENILMTNNHVLPDRDAASRSIAQFGYELNEHGQAVSPVNFRLRPDLFFLTSSYQKNNSQPYSGLDFTLVAVEENGTSGAHLDTLGYTGLDEGLGKVMDGENCVIIQHPKGDYKKIVLKDIRMITITDDFLLYESDTLPGSSGSMVLGLGTGEVIALHHSAVPRKDGKGNWLRKDGSLVQSGDPDEAIDWIGNEGVRISRIIQAFRQMEVPSSMQTMQEKMLRQMAYVKNKNQGRVNVPIFNIQTPMPTNTAPLSETNPFVGNGQDDIHTTSQYFEVQLVDDIYLQLDWKNNASRLIPGFISMELLSADSWDANLPQLYYLEIQSNEKAWDVAERIERLPHVSACSPDLATPTDGVLTTERRILQPAPFESEIYNRGDAELNEHYFKEEWKTACWIVNKQVKAHKGGNGIRWWNWYAINHPSSLEALQGWVTIKSNLSKLALVQLDTGYSTHSKVANGFNLENDIDFVDDDPTARDEEVKGVMKHPYHGTRTASIIIGGKLKLNYKECDGNAGLLSGEGKPFLQVTPYRIANSVVLLGRIKVLVEAAKRAITTGSDVMFMCMGVYPRPMIDYVARMAYEYGVIWVCAAGNEVEAIVAPASYPGTIAVAATNPNDKPWRGSSYGAQIDIAAPGEKVYVPFLDKDKNEIMVYGDGTSYATPHIATAAMLWKAKHLQVLETKYAKPWQRVEAFRYCLRKSARKPKEWNAAKYGAGILDMQALLAIDLPEVNKLKHAYAGKAWPKETDLGIRQTVGFFWNLLTRKLDPRSPESFTADGSLNDRGKQALEIFLRNRQEAGLESSNRPGDAEMKKALHTYFQQY